MRLHQPYQSKAKAIKELISFIPQFKKFVNFIVYETLDIEEHIQNYGKIYNDLYTLNVSLIIEPTDGYNNVICISAVNDTNRVEVKIVCPSVDNIKDFNKKVDDIFQNLNNSIVELKKQSYQKDFNSENPFIQPIIVLRNIISELKLIGNISEEELYHLLVKRIFISNNFLDFVIKSDVITFACGRINDGDNHLIEHEFNLPLDDKGLIEISKFTTHLYIIISKLARYNKVFCE